MTPVSLMPPVDYCPSCEGRKAESQAHQVGEARAQQIELQSADAAEAIQASDPVTSASQAGEAGNSQPVDNAAQPLLAPDLAVQALLSRPAVDAASGDDPAVRLRAAQAYGPS